MKIMPFNFQTLDWAKIPKEEHSGEAGMAYWQTIYVGDIRVRQVEYSPGYKADHWCRKGHVLHCLEGQMFTELENGKVHLLKSGMSYLVGDNCEAHRSSTESGCKLLIVD